MFLGRASVLAATIVLAFAGAAFAKPTAVIADVNLREAPATTSKILTLIPKGSTVEVASCTNGWCQVSFNSQQGYAIATNLGMGPPRTAVRRPPPQVYAGGPPPGYADEPVYVGPPPPYPYYYGYYGPYFGPRYWGPRFGFGWGWRRW